jgi:hypothetical protein
MKYTASRLSSGNKLFPAEIHLEPSGITVKIPGFFSGESKHFDFQHIASVDIENPLMGYSTITIYAGGTQMSAHGFTKAEVKEVKESIEIGKLAFQNSSNKETNTIIHTNSGGCISIADELKKMKDLLDSGVITQHEFDAHKEKLLK